MPIYEYFCEKCRETFTVTMSMTEYDQARVSCPKCLDTKVIRQYSRFFAKTSRKS